VDADGILLSDLIMAELGLIAGIIQIVGTGTRLSIAIF
jgi:hypothetical protein